MRTACLAMAAACGLWIAQAPPRGGTTETTSGWIRALEDPDPAIRHRARWQLRAVGAQAVEPLLARLRAADASTSTRVMVASTLGLIGADAKGAVPALEGLCDEGTEPELRRAAALSLGQIDGKAADRALAVLIELLGHRGRVAAATAFDIGNIGPRAQAAVPALVGLLRDGDRAGRAAAAYALARIGPVAREAVPALREALQDEDPAVVRNAQEALRSVDDTPVPR